MIRVGVFFAFLHLVFSLCWASNGIKSLSTSIRAIGRGGADIAVADDALAMNSNPAGIAMIDGKQFDMVLLAFLGRYSLSNTSNSDSDNERIPLAGPYFGYVWDQPLDGFFFFSDVYETLFNKKSSSRSPRFLPTTADKGRIIFEAQTIPKNVQVFVRGHGVEIHEMQLHGFYHKASAKRVFFPVYELAYFPAPAEGGRIIGGLVKFEWRKVSQVGSKSTEVLLQMDGKEQKKTLSNELFQWQESTLSMVLDQETIPRHLQLMTKEGDGKVEFRNIRTYLGYRYNSSYSWPEIHRKEEVSYAGQDLAPHLFAYNASKKKIDNEEYQLLYEFNEGQTLPEAALLQQIQIRYQMNLISHEYKAPFCSIKVLADGKEVGSNHHSISDPEADRYFPYLELTRTERFLERETPWKFGFGIVPQAGAKLEQKIFTEIEGEVETFSELTLISATPTIAYQFNKHFSIGVSLNLNVGRVEFDAPIAQDASLLAGMDPLLGGTFGETIRDLLGQNEIKGLIDVEETYSYGIGGRVGVLWRPTEWLSLGAVYIPKTLMADYKGKAHVDFTSFFNQEGVLAEVFAELTLPNGGAQGLAADYDFKIVDFQLPQEIDLGIAFRPIDSLLIAVDFRWIQWSDTMKSFRVKLTNGNNPDVNTLAGSDSITADLSNNWKDQYVIAVGVEYALTKQWIFRVGYNWSNNPIPDDDLTPQIPAIVEHHLTLGVTYRYSPSIAFHLAYEHDFKKSVSTGTHNSNSDWSNSRISAEQDWLLLGVSINF